MQMLNTVTNLVTAPAEDLIAILKIVKELRKCKRKNDPAVGQKQIELTAAVKVMFARVGWAMPDHRSSQALDYRDNTQYVDAKTEVADIFAGLGTNRTPILPDDTRDEYAAIGPTIASACSGHRVGKGGSKQSNQDKRAHAGAAGQ
jgi:hypothetical protein